MPCFDLILYLILLVYIAIGKLFIGYILIAGVGSTKNIMVQIRLYLFKDICYIYKIQQLCSRPIGKVRAGENHKS